jgi:hypothetical protein
MTYDHESTRIHRRDLDREIDSIRTERLLAQHGQADPGVLDRARRWTGHALISAGRALVGTEAGPLRAHEA